MYCFELEHVSIQDKHLGLLKIYILLIKKKGLVCPYMFGWISLHTELLVAQIKISQLLKW